MVCPSKIINQITTTLLRRRKSIRQCTLKISLQHIIIRPCGKIYTRILHALLSSWTTRLNSHYKWILISGRRIYLLTHLALNISPVHIRHVSVHLHSILTPTLSSTHWGGRVHHSKDCRVRRPIGRIDRCTRHSYVCCN